MAKMKSKDKMMCLTIFIFTAAWLGFFIFIAVTVKRCENTEIKQIKEEINHDSPNH